MSNILLILLIGHFLGDYYFQSENVARKKKDNILYLIIHLLIIMLINLAIYFLSNNQSQMLVLLFIITVSHILIDIIKYIFESFIEKSNLIYLMDQMLHLLVIVITYIVFKDEIFFQCFYFSDFLITKNILPILLSFLIIGKPTNVSFSVMFKHLKPKDSTTKEETEEEDEVEKGEKNVGRIIGTLERYIVLTLFLINAISSVGLIIAAKTLTRYNKITKDEGFAEYYLLGTLYSLAVTFLTIFLFLK